MAEELTSQETEELNGELISPMNTEEPVETLETEPTDPEPIPPTEDETGETEGTTEPEVTEPEAPEPEPEVEEPKNENKNRRKRIMKYGLKEVADVIFFDVKTGRPVLVFDT